MLLRLSSFVGRLLTNDFVPGANRYVYWLKSPLACLALAATGALLCGLFVASQGLVIAASIGIVIAVGLLWPWLGLQGITCEVIANEQRGREGERYPLNVIVHNRWPWPVWGLSLERLSILGPGENPIAVSLAHVPGWSRTEFTYDFMPPCRGVYPRETPVIATEFPFGLWKAKRAVSWIKPLIVWPATVPLSELPIAPGATAAIGYLSEQQAGNDGERVGVRSYRHGDPLRSVHWVQTARQQQLMVMERQSPAQSQVTIVLDVGSDHRTGVGALRSDEAAIRVAASIAKHFLQSGIAVRVIADQTYEFAAGGCSERRLMDMLAHLQLKPEKRGRRLNEGPSGKRNDSFFRIVASQSDSRSVGRVIVITFGPDASLSKSAGLSWITLDDSEHASVDFARQWRQRAQEVWRGR